MPQISPFGEIIYPINGVKNVVLDEYIEAPMPGFLRDVFADGSRWVHPSSIATTPPDSHPLYVRTTPQTSKGYILVTL